MQIAGGAGLGGQRDIHRLGGVAGRQRGLFHLGRQRLILRLRPVLELVDGLAHGRTVLFGHVPQRLGEACHRAVLAQKFLPERRQFRLIGDGRARLLDGGAQFLDFFFHSTPLLCTGRGKTKRPRPWVCSGTKPCKNSAVPPVFRTRRCGTLCLPVTVQDRCALPSRFSPAFPAHRSGGNFGAASLQAACSR